MNNQLKSLILAETGPLVRLSLPLIFAMVGQMAINTTDMLMLGRVGPEALAAAALGLSIFHPLLLLGIGIGLAVTPLTATARGHHQSRRVRRVIRQGVWAALPFTILCFPLFWWSGWLFDRIGQAPELSGAAEGYLRAMFAGLFFALLFNLWRSFLTAFELTRAVLLVTLVAVPLNAGLNYVLIFGALGVPALGVVGAGLGSAMTNTFMGVALTIVALRTRSLRHYALANKFWRPDWPIFVELHRLGIPIGLLIVLEVSVFAGSAQIMGLIGTLELAAHQIAIQLASITFMVPLGVGQAATARVGLAFGEFGMARAAAAGWAAMLLSTAAMTITALTFWLAPEPLVAVFLDEGPEFDAVMRFAVSFLAVAAAFQIFDGLQVTATHALRGLHDTTKPMWIAALCYWGIAMPLALGLGLYTQWRGVGVWLGLAAGLAVAGIAFAWRFRRMTVEVGQRKHQGANQTLPSK